AARSPRRHRAFGPPVEAAAELEFFFGALRLPVAERNRNGNERRRRDPRRDYRTKGPPADADSRHDFTRSTLGAEGSLRRTVKIVVILLFVAILASLGSALFFLVTDGGQSKRP